MMLLAAYLLLLAAVTVVPSEGSAFDKHLYHSRVRGNKQGPNVCAVQQIEGTGKKYYSSCKQWYARKICGQPTVVTYDCCPGYVKVDGINGCSAITPMENVYNTMGYVEAMSTQSYFNTSGLRPNVESSGIYTVFTPSDEAWEALSEDIREALVSNVNLELRNALSYHMVSRRLLTSDLRDGLVLTSNYENQPLFINHHSNGVVTVNCARLIRPNFLATNGVVHTIDRVIVPVSNRISEIVEFTAELESLKVLMEKAGMMPLLSSEGPLTLFAPTNEAIEKVPKETMDRIMADPKTLRMVLEGHMMRSVICSESLLGEEVLLPTAGGAPALVASCQGSSIRLRGGGEVTRRDIVTTNGVVHLIDQLVLPDSAKDVLEVAEDSGVNIFMDLLEESGAKAQLHREEGYTLLTVKDSALTESFTADKGEKLKQKMLAYVVRGRYLSDRLFHGQRLETLAGGTLRVFIYHRALCIESSCVDTKDRTARNGAVFVLDKPLPPPPRSTLMNMLEADTRFTTLASLLRTAGFAEKLSMPVDLTIFAPTNEAFGTLPVAELARLSRNSRELQELLLSHVSSGILVRGGLIPIGTNLVMALSGVTIDVMQKGGVMSINEKQTVIEADLMATNGVIHVIDGVLGQRPSRRRHALVNFGPGAPSGLELYRRLTHKPLHWKRPGHTVSWKRSRGFVDKSSHRKQAGKV
ncbi:transforming growth factor-beta-induced protein ig-h3-like [Lethenteron reissneri]|uniref:transforming growth factor-beta-induced protein ig-h3-like n=1 Tax=Lethenteron reissneri TaxID=7753 RepID=UPI002AB61839|nr:transforming growth factor-beta-induced protein ig-h3-like [Lethenteron reissneri]